MWTISWTRALFSAFLVLFLAGCVTQQPRPSVSVLPTLKQYSPEFQKGLKGELPTVRACCPKTNEVVKDYGILREKIRRGQAVQARQTTVKKGLFGGLLK